MSYHFDQADTLLLGFYVKDQKSAITGRLNGPWEPVGGFDPRDGTLLTDEIPKPWFWQYENVFEFTGEGISTVLTKALHYTPAAKNLVIFCNHRDMCDIFCGSRARLKPWQEKTTQIADGCEINGVITSSRTLKRGKVHDVLTLHGNDVYMALLRRLALYRWQFVYQEKMSKAKELWENTFLLNFTLDDVPELEF